MFEHGHISPEPTSASPHNSAFDVEILRGHFFKLDLFEIENDIGEKCVMGGSLQYGTDSVTLDPDHARQSSARSNRWRNCRNRDAATEPLFEGTLR
jgi:hypothetical protein